MSPRKLLKGQMWPGQIEKLPLEHYKQWNLYFHFSFQFYSDIIINVSLLKILQLYWGAKIRYPPKNFNSFWFFLLLIYNIDLDYDYTNQLSTGVFAPPAIRKWVKTDVILEHSLEDIKKLISTLLETPRKNITNESKAWNTKSLIGRFHHLLKIIEKLLLRITD